MTSSSPLEQAIQRISRTGWMLRSLSRSEYNSVSPWLCELYPAHFGGSYYRGTVVKLNGSSIIVGAMSTVMESGATALDAVNNAIAALDKSPVKAVYDDLQQAFEDWMDAAQTIGDRG